MSNVIAMPETAPSYLAALIAAHPELASINNEALSGSAKPMPPSIVADKGKFIIKKDGQETIITFPDTDANRAAGIVGMPVPQLQAVILKGKPGKEKAYYVTKYQPGQEATSPDCFSDDGVKPDPSSRLKQCDNCASCPQNVFGSGTKQDGSASEGKACSDRKVVAVFAAGSVYRFAIPPASLSGKRASGLGLAWDPYCNSLNTKGLPLTAVITAISFEQGQKDHQLNFNFGGVLAEKQLAAIIPMLGTPEVKEIIGGRNSALALAAPPAQQQIETTAVDTTAEKAKKEAAEAEETAKKEAAAEKKRLAAEKKKAEEAAKAAASTPAGLDDFGLNLSPEPVATAAAPQATSGPSDEDLIASLGL